MLLLDVSAVAASAILAAGDAAAFSAASSSAFVPDAPPFDTHGTQLITKCALRAQQRRRHAYAQVERTAAGPQSPAATDWTITDGTGPLASDANESYLNGLPIRQARYDNVQRRGALFCRSGIWLEIGDKMLSQESLSTEDEEPRTTAQRLIRGVRADNSRFLLEFLAVAFGLVSIRGAVSRNFLCMDAHGELYAASPANYSAQCVFMEEMLENHYNLYSSCSYGTRHRPWYVALHRSGHSRKGRTTRKKHKSSHFLVTYFDHEGNGYRNYDSDYSSDENDRAERRRLRRRFSFSATQMLPRHLLSAASRKYYGLSGQSTQRRNYGSKNEKYRHRQDATKHSHRKSHSYSTLGASDENVDARRPADKTSNTVDTHHYAHHHDRYRFSIQMDSLLDDSSVGDEPPVMRPTHYHRQHYHNDTNTKRRPDNTVADVNNPSSVDAYFPNSLFDGRDASLNQAGDISRRQRLLREEKRRKQRIDELEQLRKLALEPTASNHQRQSA